MDGYQVTLTQFVLLRALVAEGAVILLNGEEQKTKGDGQNPETTVIGKKAGKEVKAGDKLQVRNPNGTLSEEFIFTAS